MFRKRCVVCADGWCCLEMECSLGIRARLITSNIALQSPVSTCCAIRCRSSFRTPHTPHPWLLYSSHTAFLSSNTVFLPTCRPAIPHALPYTCRPTPFMPRCDSGDWVCERQEADAALSFWDRTRVQGFFDPHPSLSLARFIPVSVDCNSCYNHHMAGMANTAPRPCLHTITHSHTPYRLYLLL